MSALDDVIGRLEIRIADLQRAVAVLKAEVDGAQAPSRRTQWDYVKAALEQEQRPMSTADLVEAMHRMGWQSSSQNPTTMIGVLLKNQQKKGLAAKFGRGLWGLPGWQRKARRVASKARAASE